MELSFIYPWSNKEDLKAYNTAEMINIYQMFVSEAREMCWYQYMLELLFIYAIIIIWPFLLNHIVFYLCFRNEWHKFHSVTNIFWMRYLADKLLKMKSFPSKRGTTPTVTQFKKILLGFIERSKHYHSAVQMVFTDEIFQKYSVASEAGSDWDENILFIDVANWHTVNIYFSKL